MNESIRELLILSEVFNKDGTVLKDVTEYELNKFAELLIRKCADIADTNDCNLSLNGDSIRMHFGVEE